MLIPYAASNLLPARQISSFRLTMPRAPSYLAPGIAQAMFVIRSSSAQSAGAPALSCHHHGVSSVLIDQGVAALRAGDTVTARSAFELALADTESGAALEGLAEALYWQRDYSAAAAHYE